MKYIQLFALILGVSFFTFNTSHAESEMQQQDLGSAKVGSVHISNAYARASLGRAANSAIYLNLTSLQKDTLVSVSSSTVKKAELHQHIEVDGVMKMSAIKQIDILPNQIVELKPSGLHIMLFGLYAPFNEGMSVPLTLNFEKAGKLDMLVPVRGLDVHSMNHKKKKY